MHAAESLRSGAWLTRERIRIYSLFCLLALLASIGYELSTAQGLNDSLGRPLGVDFSNVYAAGSYAREGHAAAAFDPAQQFLREKMIFGNGTQLYGWHYPPLFLFAAAALAALPYLAALAFWELLGFAAYLAAMRRILPVPAALLPMIGFTGVWVNALNGNNGFLTAALFGGALALLPTRGILAGILFGLLAYKPQYGLLVPLALLAGGYWRTALSAALTVLLLCGMSVASFGLESWAAFAQFMAFTRHTVLEQGDTGFYKMQSLFAWIRDCGGDLALAYGVQGLATLLSALLVIRTWHRPVAFELKAAILLLGTLAATPYVMDYDLMLLAPALAFLVRHGMKTGFLPYEKTLMFCAWLVPLLARGIAQMTGLFPGCVIVLLLLGVTVWHVQRQTNAQRGLHPDNGAVT